MAALLTAKRSSPRLDPSLQLILRPAYTRWSASTPEEVGAHRKEVVMFDVIDRSALEPSDRKLLLYKIGMIVVAIAAVGGVVFLCLRSMS
jgi:hypothetical protein